MEFDHLKGFYHVAKLGSFTAAATRLYLTQPAISLQVKALESEVGERLLDRVGRKVRLTHAGEIVFKQAEDLLSRLDDLKTTVRELKELERGHLALGASDTTSIYFLPSLLKIFRVSYPRLEVSIKSLVSPQVVKRVLEREVDIGIVTLSKDALGLEVVPLFTERLVCIASREHAFSARKLVGAEEIAAQPLILLERGSITRERVDAFLSRAGSLPRPMMELSNFEIIKRYVAADHGVSIVPQASVSQERDAVSVLELTPELSVLVGAVYRKERKLSYPAKAFLELAHRFFRIDREPVVTPPGHGLGIEAN